MRKIETEVDLHKGFPEIDIAAMLTRMGDRSRTFDVYGSDASLAEIEFVLKRFMTEEEFAAALIAIRITNPLE